MKRNVGCLLGCLGAVSIANTAVGAVNDHPEHAAPGGYGRVGAVVCQWQSDHLCRNFYYPAGPRVHFMPFEMVRSGDFLGIPLYSRTTIEPYSVVFIPVGGGMMQPYERRREGELAGTVGSSAPSFPVLSTPTRRSITSPVRGRRAAAFAELAERRRSRSTRPVATGGTAPSWTA